MSTRRSSRSGSIASALSRQAKKAEAAAKTADWQPLEVTPAHLFVPEAYTSELTDGTFETYIKKRPTQAQLAARRAAAAQRDSHSHSRDDQYDRASLQWQAAAEYCLRNLSLWPGSNVALPLQQQEVLLHIMVDHDLHPDPVLSSRAYTLLLQNLMTHPPVKLVHAQHSGNNTLPVLQCATREGACWDLFERLSHPLLPDAQSPFPMLQQLVRNALQLVSAAATGSTSSSAVGGGSAGGNGSDLQQPSQGQALLLLYVVQLLQADLLVRQAAFERYMRLSSSLDEPAQQDEARKRAGVALQHSLLYRVVADDAGDSWRYSYGSTKGKHHLVRDLLMLVSWCSTDTPPSGSLVGFTTQHTPGPPAPQPAAAAAAVPAADAAAAGEEGGADSDVEMSDLDVGLPAAPPAAAPAAAAAAAAAAADRPDTTRRQPAAVESAAPAVPKHVQPVSAVELCQAGRLLLVLLLQLYSSCEEAGVYGGGEGRHQQRKQTNDRFELDDVIAAALGVGNHGISATLKQLQRPRQLTGLLLALPPVHRVRLLGLLVAMVIHSRVNDVEAKGAGLSAHSLELQGLEQYISDRGKGSGTFRLPSALHILQAVEARLDWAASSLFGGQQQFALMMGVFISTAMPGVLQGPRPDQEAFAATAQRILQHAVAQQRTAASAAAGGGAWREALTALSAAASALQSLPEPAP